MDYQLALIAEARTVSDNVGSQFMRLRNRVGLVKASKGVIFVCEIKKSAFNECVMGEKLPRADKMLSAITSVVLKEVVLKCFHYLTYHMYESTVDSIHVYNLIK